MNIASPWRPDRYEIRENPEPGVISAIFDTDHPERPACFFPRPELENADSRFCLVTECPGNAYRCARSAARERQAAMLNGMNDRFVLYDGGKEIRISDALRRHKFTRNSVARAKCGWDYDRYTLSFSPNPRRRQSYCKDDALDELTVLKEALNGRPTEPWAESFAARYLAAHPYPHSRLNLPMEPPPPAPNSPDPERTMTAAPAPKTTTKPELRTAGTLLRASVLSAGSPPTSSWSPSKPL